MRNASFFIVKLSENIVDNKQLLAKKFIGNDVSIDDIQYIGLLQRKGLYIASYDCDMDNDSLLTLISPNIIVRSFDKDKLIYLWEAE